MLNFYLKGNEDMINFIENKNTYFGIYEIKKKFILSDFIGFYKCNFGIAFNVSKM